MMSRFGLSPEGTKVCSINDYLKTQEPGLPYYDAFQKYIEHCTVYLGGLIGEARVNNLNIIFDISNVSLKLRKIVCESLPNHYHIAVNIHVPKGIRMERLQERKSQMIPEDVLGILEKEWVSANIKSEPWLDETLEIRND